jgi:hypothetical protein
MEKTFKFFALPIGKLLLQYLSGLEVARATVNLLPASLNERYAGRLKN